MEWEGTGNFSASFSSSAPLLCSLKPNQSRPQYAHILTNRDAVKRQFSVFHYLVQSPVSDSTHPFLPQSSRSVLRLGQVAGKGRVGTTLNH